MVLFLGSLTFVLQYPLKYWLGYYEKSLAPLYGNFFLWVAAFGLFLVLCVMLISQKEGRLNTIAALAAFIGLEALGPLHVIPRPHDMILYGMRDRLMREGGPEMLRNFAQDFDKLPNIPENSGWLKMYLRKDIAQTDLAAKYPFLTWIRTPGMNGSEGPSYISEYDDIVDVRWGGALYGHWGFSVAVKGQKIYPKDGYNVKTVEMGDDIFLVIGED